jgi:hypothetical protein
VNEEALAQWGAVAAIKKKIYIYILTSVASPALQYFSTLTNKRDDFRKKKLLNIKYVL